MIGNDRIGRSYLLMFGLIGLLTDCHISDRENIDNRITENSYETQEIRKQQIEEKLHNSCSTINYEVTDFYQNIEEPRENDTLQLIDILEEIGYEMTSYGRGNWTGGPRILSFHYKKGNCICEVSKLYYGSSKVIEKITERINCIVEDDK